MLSGAIGPWGTFAYGYDSVGNRASLSFGTGNKSPLDTYTYAAGSNRLADVERTEGNKSTRSRQFTYDDAGNTLSEVRTVSNLDDSWAYTYDVASRLSSVSLNGVQQAEYAYNHLGQQVLRTVWQGGVAQKTVSVHDQWGHRIAEHDGVTGTLLREYVWLGDRPVAVAEGGALFAVHVDHIGRPVLATDAAGAVCRSLHDGDKIDLGPFAARHFDSSGRPALTICVLNSHMQKPAAGSRTGPH